MSRNRMLDTSRPSGWLSLVRPGPPPLRGGDRRRAPAGEGRQQKLLVSCSGSRFFGLNRDDLRSLHEGARGASAASPRDPREVDGAALRRGRDHKRSPSSTSRPRRVGGSQTSAGPSRRTPASPSGRGGRDYIDEAPSGEGRVRSSGGTPRSRTRSGSRRAPSPTFRCRASWSAPVPAAQSCSPRPVLSRPRPERAWSCLENTSIT